MKNEIDTLNELAEVSNFNSVEIRSEVEKPVSRLPQETDYNKAAAAWMLSRAGKRDLITEEQRSSLSKVGFDVNAASLTLRQQSKGTASEGGHATQDWVFGNRIVETLKSYGGMREACSQETRPNGDTHKFPVNKNDILTYVYRDGNVTTRYTYDQVIHIRHRTTDTIMGTPLIDGLEDAICSGLNIYSHLRDYFDNGTFSKLVWTLPENASRNDEKAKKFVDTIKRAHGGKGNRYRDVFLQSGASVEGLSANNQTSETTELLKFQIVVAAQILGLPPNVLGAAMNSSYNSQEYIDRLLLRSINSHLVQTEQELSSKLIDESDLINRTRWIEFNRKAAVQMDAETEMKLLTKGLNNSIYSLEHVRKILNTKIDNQEGETYFHQSNLIKHIEGEIVEPEQPPVEPEPLEEVEQEQQKAEPDQRLAKLVESNLDRFLTRVGNSNKDLSEHRSVWDETFGDFEHQAVVFDHIAKFTDGSKDSRKTVISNLNRVWMQNTLLNEEATST